MGRRVVRLGAGADASPGDDPLRPACMKAPRVGGSRVAGARRLRSAVRPSLAAVGVLGLIVLAAAPAGAVPSPLTLTDTAGDTMGSTEARGDITSIRVANRPNRLILSFHTRMGANPARSPYWNSADSGAGWLIDVDGDATSDVDYDFLVALGRPGMRAFVMSRTAVLACTVTFTYATGTYRAEVPKRCLGNPVRVRARLGIQLRYSVVDYVLDQAPNTGFTPPVRTTAS